MLNYMLQPCLGGQTYDFSWKAFQKSARPSTRIVHGSYNSHELATLVAPVLCRLPKPGVPSFDASHDVEQSGQSSRNTTLVATKTAGYVGPSMRHTHGILTGHWL